MKNAAALRKWQQDFRPIRETDNALFLIRQEMTPLVVDNTNLASYMVKLLRDWCAPAPRDATPQFLFDADREVPTLLGTSKVRQALRHTSATFLSMTVDEVELERQASACGRRPASKVRRAVEPSRPRGQLSASL